MIAATILAVGLNSTLVAGDSRCNDLRTNAIQGQLQNFAQHPALPNALNARALAIAQAQNDAQTERVILAGVCPDSDYVPLAARLYALEAWGDLLGERNNQANHSICPAADKKVMAAAVASAWVKLSQAGTAPKPPALVATLTPQIQAMATDAGVTLPAFKETTQYWEQRYDTAAKAALVDCANALSPAPSSSP